MRSKWVGFSLGLLSLIGCNALWQGYLSPLDDPTDASVDNGDLTGVPPADLTGADLTGVDQAGPTVDMTTPAKLCGFSTLPVTGKYTTYTRITTGISAASGSRIAAMDINGDGLAEIAVNNGNLVKIIKLSSNGMTCSYSATNDCNTSDPTIDVKGFQVNATKKVFIAARSNNNQNALSLCTGDAPYTAITLNNTVFTTNSPIREINVPPIDTDTNGFFLIHEKCGTADSTGDRVISISLDSALSPTYKQIMVKASFGGFEPLSAAGARFDDTAYDKYLDFLTIEQAATPQFAYYTYSPMTQTATRRGLTSGASLNGVNANNFDILSAHLSTDVYDDAIAINKGAANVSAMILSTASGVANVRPPFSIPSGSNNRLDIVFADLNSDGIDEMLIADQSGSVNAYTFDTATNQFNVSATKFVLPAFSSNLAFGIGHLESKFAPNPPDIFVLFKNTSNQFEVGVFRYVPTGVTP